MVQSSGSVAPYPVSLSPEPSGDSGDLAAVRRLESTLRQQTAILNSVLDHMSDGILVADTQGHVLLSNQAAARMAEDGALNYRSENFPLMRATRGERVDQLELLVRSSKHPSARLLSVTAAPITDESGQPIGAISSTRDVTEAKRLERTYRALAHNLPNAALVVFDRELRIVLADGADVLGRIGTSKEALEHRYMLDAFSSANGAALERMCREALSGQEPNAEFTRNDRHLAVHMVPMRDDSGEIVGAMAMTYDLTALKQAQAAMARQTALLNLMQAVATAANESATLDSAFRTTLERVCELTGCAVGHVYSVQDGWLVSTRVWHDDNPDSFAELRELTTNLRLGAGDGLPGQVLVARRVLELDGSCPNSPWMMTAESCGIRSGFAIPVIVDGTVAAVLEFYSQPARRLEPDVLDVLANVGTQLGRVVERERARKTLEAYAAELRTLSLRDQLTDLYNRRGFTTLAEQQLKQAGRRQTRLALLFVDLNGMKQINDRFGHEQGDRAICDTAAVLKSVFRSSDIIARLGGDEFVVLMLDLAEAHYGTLQRRLHDALEQHNASAGRPYQLSVSAGIATWHAASMRGVEDLLARADEAMYEQKRARGQGRG